MKIDIKNLTKQQLTDLQGQIEEQLKVSEYPPEGTICWVWSEHGTPICKHIRVADGEGRFYLDGYASGTSTSRSNYEVLSMGISFSEEVITSKAITLGMDKMLALCWDGHSKTSRAIRVINSKNSGVFSYDGRRDTGIQFDNYSICTTPIGNLPKMYRDMINACED